MTNPLPHTKTNTTQLILHYSGAYLLGILSAILFTPVRIELAGLFIFPFYLLAILGFALYYLYLSPHYVFGPETTYWLVGQIGGIPFALQVLTALRPIRTLQSWRPLWIGFPIGFIGTLGVYYTAAASI